jgi:hypothetical protein
LKETISRQAKAKEAFEEEQAATRQAASLQQRFNDMQSRLAMLTQQIDNARFVVETAKGERERCKRGLLLVILEPHGFQKSIALAERAFLSEQVLPYMEEAFRHAEKTLAEHITEMLAFCKEHKVDKDLWPKPYEPCNPEPKASR